MSQQAVDIRQLEANWNGLAAAAQTYGLATIDVEHTDRTLYFNFEISCKGKNSGRPCGGHLNLQHGFDPAHLTLMSWNGSRKTNYWYYIAPNGSISDSKPPPGMKSDIQGTSVGISALPAEIGGALKRLIQDAYANCFPT